IMWWLLKVVIIILTVLSPTKCQSKRRKGQRDDNQVITNDVKGKLEILFIVDSSEKAKTLLFERQKEFILRFSTKLMQLRSAGWRLRLRLAALQYSSTVSVEHNFKDWQDLDVFQGRVAAMTFIGHGTYSAYAITNATQLFTHETSSSSLKVALLMMDGTDHPRSPSAVTAAAEARQLNIRIFAIRLSGLHRDGTLDAKLRSIASAPPQQHVLSLMDSQLDDRLFSEVVSYVCDKATSMFLSLSSLTLKGEQGPRGASGPPGDSGIGFPGPKGDRGYEGPKGSRGTPGLGYKGDKGNIGVPGLPGLMGFTGADIQGEKGDQGPIGPSGPRGPAGLGIAGPKGDQGFPGEPGPQGERGVGEPGPKGEPGPEGAAGIPGIPGEDGAVGPKVSLCICHLSIKQGDPGPVGLPGPVGEAGVGISGPKGEPGYQGQVGPRGAPGDGLLGEKGDRGIPGDQGKKGDKGDYGEPGSTGPVGRPGEKGEPGLTVSCALKCKESPVELVFVIDSSESVGPENFELVKDFVNGLIDQMSVSQEAVRIGVVLYSHLDIVVVSLQQQSSQDDIKAAIRKMPYLGEGTFTGSAIHQASQLFQASRPHVRKVAMVLTDGQADPRDVMQLEETATEAHTEEIEMFVIGVMNKTDPLYEKFQAETNVIASDPDEDHVYLIEDFKTLPSKQKNIQVMGFYVSQMSLLFDLYLNHHVFALTIPKQFTHCSLLVFSDEGCSQPLDPGPCRQYVIKWYYDPEANACAQFWYGGCHSNANNFETEANCRNACVHT
uniref:Collagen type XXVIII alpha 1 chain n=1 Tax=Mastacembelus armatus TaxID=205130 RepID=A0A3Q3KJQ6_9TELE